MKFKWDKKYLYWGITAFLVIVSSILFFLMLDRFQTVWSGLQFIFNLIMPFIIAFVIAYLLIPIADFFECKCFAPLLKRVTSPKLVRLPRILAIFITVLLALAVVIGLIGMVIPQLLNSVINTANSLPGYIAGLQKWVTDLTASNPDIEKILEELFSNLSRIVTDWSKNDLIPQASGWLGGLTSGVMGALGILLDIFVGIVVAIYIMFSRERFTAQIKKMTYAVCSVKAANRLIRVTRRADRVFGGFIKGKLIDSVIIGVLCFIGMSLFQMKFALLISVIIGVSNIIPFFGPFIGAVPSALLILMADLNHPLNCVFFVIFIIVLQQFDGNILGPKILGETTGLSAFWVIFSILLFGGMFGFVGMIIGVPAFALIYSFVAEFAHGRLRKQNLPVETSAYQTLDRISEEDHQPVAMKPPEPKPKRQKRRGKKSERS